MNTLTKDFSGEYDYPAEEADAVSDNFLDYCEDYTRDEMVQKVIKERAHWLRVFGDDEQGKADMRRFCEVFNAKIAPKINFFM